MCALTIRGAFQEDLCQVQQPLSVRHLLRPIELDLQLAKVTQRLPLDVNLLENTRLHLSALWFGAVLIVQTNLKGEDHQTAHILRALHGPLTNHLTTEED